MPRALVPLILLLACLVGVAPARADVAPDWVGVNAQWLFPAYERSSGLWDAQVDQMASAGVKVVRLDAEWRRVEPRPPDRFGHHYVWGFYDGVVATLAERGIRWYPIVDYSAPWSAAIPGQWRSPPASIDEFAGYAAALVRRYGANGTFWAAHPELPQVPVGQWEIWNEQNGSYFWPSAPDPARYADLYAASRAAIRTVDASATVVVGGLINHSARPFLNQMFSARPALEVDAVGLHAYAPTVAGVLSWIRGLRATLTANGRGAVPIEVTEVGWTTGGTNDPATDAQRADLLRTTIPAVSVEAGVTRLILHTWVSREAHPLQDEDWYGLFHPDATPTLSGQALITSLAELFLAGPADPKSKTTREAKRRRRCQSGRRHRCKKRSPRGRGASRHRRH